MIEPRLSASVEVGETTIEVTVRVTLREERDASPIEDQIAGAVASLGEALRDGPAFAARVIAAAPKDASDA